MSGKIKLINKTGWDTHDLRKFVLAGLKAEVGKWYNYTVTIANAAVNTYYVGWGWYNQNKMKLVLPPVDDRAYTFSRLFLTSEQIIRIARTLAHEVQHNKGEHHRGMVKSRELPVEWAYTLVTNGFRINRAPQPTPKPKRDIQAERQAHAEKMLAKHESDLKRKQKLVKNWRTKVRYYERAAGKKAAARTECDA